MRIHYPAVIVAALVYWVLGAVWYTVFANQFIALKGFTPEEVAALQAAGATRQIAVALLSSVVISYVLAHFVRYVRAESAADGVKTAFWLCLGFVLTTNLETVLFEGRPLGLYLINNGYHFVGFLLMGALLAVWKRGEGRVPAYQT